jgi:hypothetical protein
MIGRLRQPDGSRFVSGSASEERLGSLREGDLPSEGLRRAQTPWNPDLDGIRPSSRSRSAPERAGKSREVPHAPRAGRRVCLAFLCAATLAGAARVATGHPVPQIHHDLEVRLWPAEQRLEAEDLISFPAWPPAEGPVYFRLHASLEIESTDPAYVLEPISGEVRSEWSGVDGMDEGATRALVREYRLSPAEGAWPRDPKPRLRLRGTIHHPLVDEDEEYARSFSRTAGIISEDGVMLWGSSFWLPQFGEALMSFRLTATVPEGWDVVSQGKRTLHETEGASRRVRWESPEPADEVYLVAGRFTEYSRTCAGITAYAFLRSPDPSLAARYLEATAQYIEMYSELIDPYPFAKFALVENFWETGYGMPSFTLLGPKVIRLPFILHSSFPHEILHNWWGNSVFVDYERGNWSEGLTTYLADHLIKEGQGGGSDYRHDSLERYSAYVREGKDFPLSHFGSRHSAVSEAIGYGKSLMLWHMLRLRLGDEKFVEGLQRFYLRYHFRRASFADAARVFSKVAGEDVEPFFQQWVERTGAPVLSLKSDVLDERRIRVRVRQEQPGDPYELTVPLAVTVAGEPEARIFFLPMREQESELELTLPAPGLRVDLDPYFDVFRRLDPRETPPALRDLFGAERVTFVLPREEGRVSAEDWEEFARAWSGGSAREVDLVEERELASLPADRAVWVLGSRNGWRRALLPSLAGRGAGLEGGEIRAGDLRVPETGHSFVFSARHPERPDLALAWVGTDDADALPGLARKLPHYERYSYLIFSGDEPTNVGKGQWPALESPLARALAPSDVPDVAPGEAPEVEIVPPRAELPARAPLARLAPVFDPERLMEHVAFLAGDPLEGRGAGTPGLREAGDYIASAFRSAGLEPAGDDGGYFQTWTEPEGPDGGPVTLRNVVGVLPGRNPDWELQSVVVGAHYDHLGRGWPDVRAGEEGEIHNGADDNASGVAVLLELAALLGREVEPERSLAFVAFSGEEWDRKGSSHYVTAMDRWPARECLAMVNLDSVGRLEGEKISLLGAGSADEWIHIAMGVGFTTGIEASSILNDPGGSDQRSFHEAGIPAIQIFTGAHGDYHRPSDDVDKIDADGLVKVATLTREIVEYLSERDRPLTSRLAATREGGTAVAPVAKRRVTLGTVPDFSFAGPGVRVASVLADSPAAVAELREGDVVVAIEGREIADLRAFADALREHRSGDVIRITIRRAEVELSVEATLTAR